MDSLAGLGSRHVDSAVQRTEETSLESQTRAAADFERFEGTINFKRFDHENEVHIVDRVTGPYNPFSKKATAKEHEVWLLDNTAYKQNDTKDGKSTWVAEFVACYFTQGRREVTEAVSRIADAIGLDGKVGDDEKVRALIAQRLQPFLTPIAPARTAEISIPTNGDSHLRHTLGPSNGNGISSQVLQAGGDNQADGTTIRCNTDGPEYPQAACETRFAGPEGWAVISDIDDTIKITQSVNPAGILRTTFAEEPRTTEGLPEFYKMLDSQFNSPAWFYLSASPYNLYPFLHQFIHNNYKPGTIILRDSSWMYFGGLLQSLTLGTKAYKTDRMRKINSWLPTRKFICVGDSTQTDPESYATMYHEFPGWVKAIYIRKVVDAPFMEEKNKAERFHKAFKDVPSNVWRLFENPKELDDHVKQVAADNN